MTLLRLALAGAALWALERELAGLASSDLLRPLATYGWTRIALALAGTVGSFLLLGGVELLALRSLGVRPDRVPSRAALGTAFLAHALSQSVGVALLTGGAVRMRSYGRRGLDASQVARVSAFVTLTVTLGLLSAGAWACLGTAAPLEVAGRTIVMRPFGAVLAIVVLAYVGWSRLGRRATAPASGWRIPRPSSPVVMGQLVLSTLDWLITGLVLYAFISADAGVGVVALLRMYVVAQTLGVLSHVPGGVGVFEVVLLALLTAANPLAARGPLLAAILMYRASYYVLPLCAAMLAAGIAEVRRLLRDMRCRRDASAMPSLPSGLLAPEGR